MTPRIKICGLSTPETLVAALEAGADMIGFVFFEPSPRHVSYNRAAELAECARGRAEIVALSVDATDERLDQIVSQVRPDWLQFQGSETPARLNNLRQRYGIRALKAIKVADSADIAAAEAYIDAADMLLYDAKAPGGTLLPGGNGLAFDWTLLKSASRKRPMMLAGGLDETNVAGAVAIAAPDAVDVSSGVESAPGVKDPVRIRRFVDAVRAAETQSGRRSQKG